MTEGFAENWRRDWRCSFAEFLIYVEEARVTGIHCFGGIKPANKRVFCIWGWGRVVEKNEKVCYILPYLECG